MRKNRGCMKNEKGSLTVEALLFLIPFMCAFLVIINAARFVQSEMLIHHAITQTAKQVSTYSYVLTKSKIADEIQDTHKKSDKFETDTNKAVDSVTQFFHAMGGIGSGDPVGEAQAVINTGRHAEDTLTEYFSDPDALLGGVFAMAQSGMEDYVLTSVVGAISKNNVKNAISQISDDPNKYLENIGIVDGLEGLDFSKSKWLSEAEGKGNLQIVATYKLENLLFPQFDFFEPYEFCQCASTLIW